jgi:large subunit ribosomal protein L5
MAAATDTAPSARLKTQYLEEIRPALIERFGYSSVMQAPKLEKITLNMGVGLAKQDSKMLKAATDQLAAIAGQQPSIRRARKSIAAFKLREGMPVGVAVTLRGERAYEFLDRLVSVAIPRIRDFRGLNPRSFDGRGNYSMGVKEQIIFPEIDYDAIDMVRGLDITITTSASNDVEAFALLSALGLPFSAERRPKEYEITGVGADGNSEAARTADQRGPAALKPAEPAAEPEQEPETDTEADEASQSTDGPADEAPAAEDAPEDETSTTPEAETTADESETSSAEADGDDETPDSEADGSEPEASEADAPAAHSDAPADGDAETTEKESTD